MATDGLTALRQCIIAGRDGGVREDGDFLIIDGVRYAADTPTAFRQSRVQSGYPLMGVWLQWKLRTLSVAEYIKASNAAKTKFVLITDKNTLLDYLMGKSEAGDYIDASKLGIAPQAPTAALESVAATSDASSQSLELAIRKEIAYRSREKVLQAPGKNLRDDVFKHFGAKPGAPPPAAAAAASSSRSGSGSAAADASRKRQRPTVSSTGTTSVSADAFGGWRGTPIIVIPSSATSLINLFNVQAFLQDGRFVHPNDARAAAGSVKPSKVLIRRKDSRGNSCQYYVVDSVEGLAKSDWLKVAAVFALGPDWQFKGWRWGREEKDPKTGAFIRPDITPTEIFERAQGFHVQFEGDVPHENIPKWAVLPLKVAKQHRYTDASVSQQFWSVLDNYIYVKKPYLLPKGVSNVGSETPASASS